MKNSINFAFSPEVVDMKFKLFMVVVVLRRQRKLSIAVVNV